MTECPKCHYIRQPDDHAPEWECPRCGIVYQKFIGRESSSPYHDDLARPADRVNKTGMMFKGVAVVLGLAFFLSGFIVWKYRDIESGDREDASGSPAGVVIYSTPTCPYCHVARALFEKYDIDYFEYDITTSMEGLSEFRELGGRAVPLILVGDTRIDGYNEQLIRNALKRAGLL